MVGLNFAPGLGIAVGLDFAAGLKIYRAKPGTPASSE